MQSGSRPHATSFDQVVERLGLSPRQHSISAELKEWARQNEDEKYVPPKLLDLWEFDVKVDLAEEPLKKTSPARRLTYPWAAVCLVKRPTA